MRLWVIDETGTHRRDVEDEDCALLAEAAATMVAVFVAPQEVQSPSPESGEPDPESSPSESSDVEPGEVEPSGPGASPPKSVPGDTRVRARRELRVGGDLRGHGHLGAGTLPGPAGGFSVAGNVDVRRLRIELLAGGTFTPQLTVREGRVSLRSWRAGLAGGFVPGWGRWEFPVTAGLEAGALVARGDGLQVERGGAVAWASLVLSPSAVFRPRPRLGLWLGLRGHVAVLRPRIVLDDGSVVHRPGAGGIRATVGVSVRLGSSTDRGPRRQPTTESR